MTRLPVHRALSKRDVEVPTPSRFKPTVALADEEAEGWARAARGGDRGAVTALLTTLLPRVRNLVRYLVRGDEDTNDMTQEALLAVLRGLSGFRAEGTLKSWVDRIVVRSTFAFIRKRRTEPSTVVFQQAHVLDLVEDATTLPDEYLSRRWVVSVLDQLPLEQRHALVLHHVLEMSVPEIAEQIQISPETVRSRLRLARARLRGKGVAVGGVRGRDGEGDEGEGGGGGGGDEDDDGGDGGGDATTTAARPDLEPQDSRRRHDGATHSGRVSDGNTD